VYFDVAMSGLVACSLATIAQTISEQRLHGFVSVQTSTFSLLLTMAFVAEVCCAPVTELHRALSCIWVCRRFSLNCTRMVPNGTGRMV
jgi:hypothetical protein